MKNNGQVVLSISYLCREHETSYDYMRLTAFVLKDLLAKHEARILNLRKVENSSYMLYTLFLDRGIVSGELREFGLVGRVVIKCVEALFPVLRPLFTRPPLDQASIYHLLLVDAVFP